MKNIEIGDRVAVYNGISGQFKSGCRGTVIENGVAGGWLRVEFGPTSEGEFYIESVHPKQCRRLKRKPKPHVIEFECDWEEDTLYGYKVVLPCTSAVMSLAGKRTKVRIEVIE